jgi:uncharacterized damage-inducible protein DinB
MFTVPMLRELYRHMEWADAHVWSAALTLPAAASDELLQEKLVHVHATQRAFLAVWTAQPLDRWLELAFANLGEVHAWAHPYYASVAPFLGGLTDEALTTPVVVPWAKMFAKTLGRVPNAPTLGETLFQVTAHTAYHRAQVNARLRELGAVPPLVDYIAWVWFGRPAPQWPEA